MARVWERVDSEQHHYPILSEESFQNFIRSYTGNYFETLSQIDVVTRQAMITHTLLIDDDMLNVTLANRAGYMAYRVPITGLTMVDWKHIVQCVESKHVDKYSSFLDQRR